MCGIVAYLGDQTAYPILIKGLKRLEYRGYDSAGVALIDDACNMTVYKAKGKVSQLEQMIGEQSTAGHCGIAHTRWATHGAPNQINAHPHVSNSGRFALIHNGIIENYAPLKQELLDKGVVFQSETDTEVIVQLMDYYIHRYDMDIYHAFKAVLERVEGAYAIVLMDKENPDHLIAARKGSPMVMGMRTSSAGTPEYFIASDASPIVEYTKDVLYLNDMEILSLDKKAGIQLTDIKGLPIEPYFVTVNLSVDELEKAGYPFFMMKEIFQQSTSLEDCLRGRIKYAGKDKFEDNAESAEIFLPVLEEHYDRIKNARRVLILACGTSWNAALIGEHLIEQFCRIPVEVEYASEFRYRNPVVYPDDFVIALSQSGETADTIAAVDKAKSSGAFIYCLCNVVGSSLARMSDDCTYLNVGPEMGVASTKAFSAQVLLLALFSLRLSQKMGFVSQPELVSYIKSVRKLPAQVAAVLETSDRIKELAYHFTFAKNFIYLGRRYNFPVALEGALKLKEISYVHADAYPAAEMKHGPIALIDEDMPVLVIATESDLYDKLMSNVQEVKARRGRVIAVITEGDEVMTKIADYCMVVPRTEEFLCPILATVPLQLFAYHVAVAKGRNVDQPRNLAKSVTVE